MALSSLTWCLHSPFSPCPLERFQLGPGLSVHAWDILYGHLFSILSLVLLSGWASDLHCTFVSCPVFWTSWRYSSFVSSPVSGPISCCSWLDYPDESRTWLVLSPCLELSMDPGSCAWHYPQCSDTVGWWPGQRGQCLESLSPLASGSAPVVPWQ